MENMTGKKQRIAMMYVKTLCAALALLLAVCVIPAMKGYAETVVSGECGDDLVWTLDDAGVLTVSGTGEMDNLSSGAPWAGYKDNILQVVIESGVTDIGFGAFKDCAALSGVSLPDTLTFISQSSFDGCTALTSIEIPEGVTEISMLAFDGCTDLTTVTIPLSVTKIGTAAFGNCGITTVYYGGSQDDWETLMSNSAPVSSNPSLFQAESIQYTDYEKACGYCGEYSGDTGEWQDNLKWSLMSDGAITISRNSESSIDSGNMCSTMDKMPWKEYRDKIKEVIIEEGVTTVGNGAFRECVNLTSVDMPDSVTVIGAFAFESCAALTEIGLPANITKIQAYTFNGCGGLTGTFIIPDKVTSIDYCAFKDCSGLTGIVLPEGLTQIANQAFENCSGMTDTLTVPDRVNNIGHQAFKGCTGLKQADLNAKNIAADAFKGCSGLETLVFGDGTETVDYQPFPGCDRISSITFEGSGITIVGPVFDNLASGATVAAPCDFSVVCDKEPRDNYTDYFKAADGSAVTFVRRHPEGSIGKEADEVPATCVAEGTEAYWKCGVCGTLFSDENGTSEITGPQSIPVDEDAHDWGKWEITSKATCKSAGEKTRVCKLNEEHSETETIPADPEAHVWDNGVITKEPTTETEGEKLFTCTLCGEKNTVVIPKLDPEDSADKENKDYYYTKSGYSWTKRSGQDLLVTVKNSEDDSDTYVKFKYIEIDGKAYDCTAEEGSVKITLKAADLEKLSRGKHTVTAFFTDGFISTTLTVLRSGSGSVPGTGDDTNVPAMVLIALSFIVSLSYVILSVYSVRLGGKALLAEDVSIPADAVSPEDTFCNVLTDNSVSSASSGNEPDIADIGPEKAVIGNLADDKSGDDIGRDGTDK